jgi:hypothetical protein
MLLNLLIIFVVGYVALTLSDVVIAFVREQLMK